MTSRSSLNFGMRGISH